MRDVLLGFLLCSSLVLMGLIRPEQNTVVRFPQARTVTVRTASTTLTAQYDTLRVRKILLLKPYKTERSVRVEQKEQKMEFARDLHSMIPKNLFLSRISVKTNRENHEYTFRVENQVDLRRFWESPELQKIWTAIHNRRTMSASVTVEGWLQSSFQSTAATRSQSGNFFSLSMQLKPGLNLFQVMLLDSLQDPVLLDSLNVFYTIPTLFDSPPDDSEPAPFHSTPAEQRCASCHTDIASSCTSCHKGLVTLPSVHPVAEDCSLCHDLSSTRESKLIEGQEFNAEFCYMCHDGKRELLETKPVVHGAGDDCLMCHDAHGTTFDSMVRDRTTTLCMMCHEEKAKEPHPIANHPLEGPKDPYRAGKKFTCTSCHDPHASDHAGLFRFPELPICQYCHGRP